MGYNEGDGCPNPECNGKLELNIHKLTDTYHVLTCYRCNTDQIVYNEKND